jgi:DNA modification methylase
LGDLWVLGDNRLLCGDATNDADVKRLMKGERGTLFSTDPPYAVGYVGGQHPESDANRGNAKRNKNWSNVYQEATQEADGEAFYGAFVSAAVRHAIEANAAWYCWHSSIRAPMVERVWNANGAFAHQQIIWVKTRAVLTYSAYMWQHEPCLMGWLRGNKPRIKSRGQEFQTTVWSVANSEIESKDHPTSKPTRLFRVPMEVHTVPGDICYEPFSGSGSQIIAAQMLGRKCYAMEIAPRFVEVAIERWQNFTGEKATLDGRAFDEIAAERRQEAA